MQREHVTLDEVTSVKIMNLVLVYVQYTMILVGPRCIVQLVTCLTRDACLTVDTGVAISTSAQSLTIAEIDHEITSTGPLKSYFTT